MADGDVARGLNRREFIKNSSLALLGSQVLACPVVALAKASYNFAFWRAYTTKTTQVFAQVGAVSDTESRTTQVFALVAATSGVAGEMRATQVFAQVAATSEVNGEMRSTQVFAQVLVVK